MRYHFIVKFTAFFILATAMSVGVGAIFGVFDVPDPVGQVDASADVFKTVVIDAGHGGEDGGTSSATGLVEKDLNLEISSMLCDMLRANGINVIMTREDDRLLYDRNVDYHGRKKVLDLAARLNVSQKTENSIFVSIHMNSFPQTQYQGLQVYYSGNHKDSKIIADIVQRNISSLLQPKNNRKTKSAGSSIYLLDRITAPAVLIECGFISNAEECAKLKSEIYQRQMSLVIANSVAEYVRGA